jgi:hypothetical protein
MLESVLMRWVDKVVEERRVAWIMWIDCWVPQFLIPVLVFMFFLRLLLLSFIFIIFLYCLPYLLLPLHISLSFSFTYLHTQGIYNNHRIHGFLWNLFTRYSSIWIVLFRLMPSASLKKLYHTLHQVLILMHGHFVAMPVRRCSNRDPKGVAHVHESRDMRVSNQKALGLIVNVAAQYKFYQWLYPQIETPTCTRMGFWTITRSRRTGKLRDNLWV